MEFRPLTPGEAHEVSMIASVAGALEGAIQTRLLIVPERPLWWATFAGLSWRGPSRASGVFLDELPEFRRGVLYNLRQPIETGVVERSAGEQPSNLSCQRPFGRGDEP